MDRSRFIILCVIIAGVIVAFIFSRTVGVDPIGVDVVFDERVITSVEASLDLDTDKERMWKLAPKESRQAEGLVTYQVSPVSAINAASRVFESEKISIIGLTLKEVLKKLGHVNSHRKGSYNFPFFPLAKDEDAIVLRFDCGSFGWQFDLLLDDSKKVRKLRRQWIH